MGPFSWPRSLASNSSLDGRAARLRYLLRSQHAFAHHAAAYLQLRSVGIDEPDENLGWNQRVVVPKGQGGRPLDDPLDFRLTGVVSRQMRQRVLDYAVLDTALAESAPQTGHLRDIQPGVVGRDRYATAFDPISDRRHLFSFRLRRQELTSKKYPESRRPRAPTVIHRDQGLHTLATSGPACAGTTTLRQIPRYLPRWAHLSPHRRVVRPFNPLLRSPLSAASVAILP